MLWSNCDLSCSSHPPQPPPHSRIPSSSSSPCLSSTLQLNLFNPRPYSKCYRWTECSKTFNLQYELHRCRATCWTEFYLGTWKCAPEKPRRPCSSMAPQSLRRPQDWKMLLQSKREATQHMLTWWLCQMQTHTQRESLFSFLRGGALVQAWPLCHHKLICFASLHLSVNLSLLTSPPSLHPPPQNSRSQNFCDQMQLWHLNFIVFISLFFTRAPGPRPVL